MLIRADDKQDEEQKAADEEKPTSPGEDHGGDVDQMREFKKMRTPFMDLTAPLQLGDDATGTTTMTTLQEKEATTLALRCVAIARSLVTAGPRWDAFKDKFKSNKSKKADKKTVEKEAETAPEPADSADAQDLAVSIGTTVGEMKQAVNELFKQWGQFFSIGNKTMERISSEVHVMHLGDLTRLKAIGRHLDTFEKLIQKITNETAEYTKNGFALAETTNVLAVWPFDNPADKAKKALKTDDPKPTHNISFHDSLLLPKKYPEDYNEAIRLGQGLGSRMGVIQKSLDRFKTIYNGFLFQAAEATKKVQSGKAKASSVAMKNIQTVVNTVAKDVASLQNSTFKTPRTNALSRVKDLLSVDRWKHPIEETPTDAAETPPPPPAAAPGQPAAETPPPAAAPGQPAAAPTNTAAPPATPADHDAVVKENEGLKVQVTELKKQLEETVKHVAPAVAPTKVETPEAPKAAPKKPPAAKKPAQPSLI